MRKIRLLTLCVGLIYGELGRLAGQAATHRGRHRTSSPFAGPSAKLADSMRKVESGGDKPIPSGWKPSTTSWGDPDIEGVYSNTDEHGIPFERAAEFEGRRLEDITTDEIERTLENREKN
jgi:hypothetical protein